MVEGSFDRSAIARALLMVVVVMMLMLGHGRSVLGARWWLLGSLDPSRAAAMVLDGGIRATRGPVASSFLHRSWRSRW